MHSMKQRIRIVFVMMLIFTAYLAYSLVQVQARQMLRDRPPTGFKSFRDMATSLHTASVPLRVLRGSILDRNHQVLASSLTLRSIAINPDRVRQWLQPAGRPQFAAFLARILHTNRQSILNKIDQHETFAWLGRKMPAAVTKKVEHLNLPGIFLVPEASGKRFYPKGRLAVHVIGYTGVDDNGLDGIEASYDAWLRGIPGYIEAETDPSGCRLPDGWVHLHPARPGRNVVLTIDSAIQFVAERQLARAVKKFHGSSGCCIVMNVRNGDILALANVPDYRTQDFAHVPESLRRDRAISDIYEPGSTMKIFTASAALDSGSISLHQQFYCGSVINVDGWPIHNADDGDFSATGSENIIGIVTHSYNVGTVSIALHMGKKIFQRYLKRFGFGRRTGIPLPGEAAGLIQPYKDWANVTLATCAFGQGITVTPIQLICSAEGAINGGVMMRPRLVKEIDLPDGTVVKRFPPRVRRRVISAHTSAEIRYILRSVVVNGTGKQADSPAYPAAGKTGTANIAENGVYTHMYNASFLGFAPYDKPQVIVLVKVEDPHPIHWGGSVCAPVFRSVVAEALWRLGVPPRAVPTPPAPKGHPENKD